MGLAKIMCSSVQLVAEVRKIEQEKVKYLNKQSGQAAEFDSKRFSVELLDGTNVTVNVRELPKELPCKGDVCLFPLTALERVGGHLTASADGLNIRKLNAAELKELA